MKLRPFFLTLAVTSALLLAVAAGGLYWILQGSPVTLRGGGIVANPRSAIFIPKTAPVVASILVDLDRLESYRQLQAPFTERRQSQQELDRLKTNLLSSFDIDYYRDIQPWLGDEITFAVTSLDRDRNPDNGVQPGYLAIATAADSQQAREFLRQYYSRQAISGTSDLIFEQYKGVNLIYRRPLVAGATAGFASAAVDRFVLLANHPKVLRDAINNAQVPALSLQQFSPYREATAQIAIPRIGEVFLNLPALSAWLDKQPAFLPPENPNTFTLALALTDAGLRAESALSGLPESAKRPPALSAPVAALDYLPRNSVLAAAGVDLQRLWRDLVTASSSDGQPSATVAQLQESLQRRTGIDAVSEIFPWVEGEFGLALVAPDDRPVGGDWVFAAQKADPPVARAAIDNLDRLAREAGLSVGKVSVDEVPVTAWTALKTASELVFRSTKGSGIRLDAEVKGTHASENEYEIFASSLEAIAAALAGQENSLLSNEDFSKAISSLPTENDGYFYLDWQGSKQYLKQEIPLLRVVELAGKPLFDHLRSLALSSRGTQNGVRRATIMLDLSAS